jgi:Arc/MetJ family transcription regulator
MRTNIDLDDSLVEQAMAVAGQRAKKAVVEEALRRLIRAHEQKQAIEDLRGLGKATSTPCALHANNDCCRQFGLDW